MKKPTQATISNRIYEFRVTRRLSQQQLGEAVNVSKQTIFAMEKGNYSPSLRLAFQLARYFNVDINDLFSYKEKEQ